MSTCNDSRKKKNSTSSAEINWPCESGIAWSTLYCDTARVTKWVDRIAVICEDEWLVASPSISAKKLEFIGGRLISDMKVHTCSRFLHDSFLLWRDTCPPPCKLHGGREILCVHMRVQPPQEGATAKKANHSEYSNRYTLNLFQPRNSISRL